MVFNTILYSISYFHPSVNCRASAEKRQKKNPAPIGTGFSVCGLVVVNDDRGAVREVVEDELTEDYAKLAGLHEAEEIDEPVFKSVKKRIVWLVCLLILGMFISLVVSQFETVIDGIPMIVFFQSVILGMSGNAGTQSLAVTIRGLMDEDL